MSHYHMLRGLALISEWRLRMLIDAIEVHHSTEDGPDDPLHPVRQTILETASLDPKSRMALDTNREIDLFVWAPMQLFFCVAYALVDRYRRLKSEFPNLAFRDLDSFINDNPAGFKAIKKLRNWVLHPGISRKPDDAMEMLFAAGGQPGNTYPLEMVYRLLRLVERFLERLNAEAG